MSILLINANQPEEIRVALLEKKNNFTITNLYIENPNKKILLKNIYAGIVSDVIPSLNALFIKYESTEGEEAVRHGFLPFSEIAPIYFKEGDRKHMGNFLDRKIIVQIKKEPRGTKGALLTTYITLAGSYLVLMPHHQNSGGISKRILTTDRTAMKEVINQLQIPKSMSIILRTAGVGKTLTELQNDLDLLLNRWGAIEAAFRSKKPPFLIFQESNILARSIRDYLRGDIEKIIVDDAKTFETVKEYTAQIRPDLLKKVNLHRNKKPLFLSFDIEDEVESAFQPVLRLPSGGSIVLNQCEALTAIDINSGGSTKHRDIAETALRTNLEAAEYIAKQLRLRDVGGLIVIDFIDMDEEEHKQQVEKKLLDSTVEDRARIQIGHISSFGLLEMSRQRLRSSLGKTNEDICPYCQGHGIKRSTESLALSVIRMLQKKLFQKKIKYIQIKASIELMTYLSNEKRDVIRQLEKEHHCTVILTSAFDYKNSDYEIVDFGLEESNVQLPSYALMHDQSNNSAIFEPLVPFEVPIVKNFEQGSTSTNSAKKGFFNIMLQGIKSLFTRQNHASAKPDDLKALSKKNITSTRYADRTNSSASTKLVRKIPKKSSVTEPTQATEKVLDTETKHTVLKRKKSMTVSTAKTSRQLNIKDSALQKDRQDRVQGPEQATQEVQKIEEKNIILPNNPLFNKISFKKVIVHRYGGEPQFKKRNYLMS